jgi:predicted DNA-binding transcriptional regulator YafY
MDWRIVRFITGRQYALSDRDMSFEDKLKTIRQAIKEEFCLEILYLKASDEKSRRIIRPFNVGAKAYLNKPFIGVEAFCLERKERRIFRVDRILEMKVVENSGV